MISPTHANNNNAESGNKLDNKSMPTGTGLDFKYY